MNELDFVTDGAWSDLRELSNDMVGYDAFSGQTLGDTFTLFPFAGGPAVAGGMTNRGGVKQAFATSIPGIPCRLDVDVKGLIPQRIKDSVEAQKVIRYLFVPTDWLAANNVMPSVKDELTTNAGRPLGDVVRYRVLDVNTETDQVDVTILVEEVV